MAAAIQANMQEIMNSPFSLWQVDFSVMTIGQNETITFTDVGGNLRTWAPSQQLYLLTAYLTAGVNDPGTPQLTSINGASGTCTVQFNPPPNGTLAGDTMRLIFLMPAFSGTFQPPFQTK